MATTGKSPGRPRSTCARDHFTFNADGYSYCKVNSCKGKIKGDHNGNLEKHLQRMHPEEYKLAAVEKSDGHSTKRQRSKSLSVVINVEDLKDACVELVTVNGRPFALMDDSGFRKIMDPLLAAIHADETCTLSSETIGELVTLRAEDVRTAIRKEVSGKLISLKVDAATRHDRAFLGINIQFIEDGAIHIRTLGIVELLEKHTADYLRTVIQKVLKEYDIDLANIYSFTSDNGANMVKLGKLLEESQSKIAEENSTEDDDEGKETDELEEEISATKNSDLLERLQSCHLTDGEVLISNLRCAAHTLQLAVLDAIKHTEYMKSIVDKARKLVKSLRKPTVRKIILRSNPKAKKAKIDVATRWNSTADMLESLIELKEFCLDFMVTYDPDVALTEEEWLLIEDYLQSLTPARQATIQLQSEQLTLGSFYRIWTECRLITENIPTTLAAELVQAMKKREKQLMENDALLASVYLDPRYLVLLPEEHYFAAITKLEAIWKTLEDLETKSGNFELQAPLKSKLCSKENPLGRNNSMSNNDAFQKHLNQRIAARTVTSPDVSDIRRLLEEYGRRTDVLDSSMDLLYYWETKKHTMPQLYKLATVVHAATATQVSVERLFSGIHFIYSDRRTNLKSRMLDDIMVVRCNQQDMARAKIEHSSVPKRQRKRITSDSSPSESSGTSTPTEVEDRSYRNISEYLENRVQTEVINENAVRTVQFSQY